MGGIEHFIRIPRKSDEVKNLVRAWYRNNGFNVVTWDADLFEETEYPSHKKVKFKLKGQVPGTIIAIKDFDKKTGCAFTLNLTDLEGHNETAMLGCFFVPGTNGQLGQEFDVSADPRLDPKDPRRLGYGLMMNFLGALGPYTVIGAQTPGTPQRTQSQPPPGIPSPVPYQGVAIQQQPSAQSQVNYPAPQPAPYGQTCSPTTPMSQRQQYASPIPRGHPQTHVSPSIQTQPYVPPTQITSNAQLTSQPAAQTPVQQATWPQVIYCMHCGMVLKPTTKFCIKCGRPVVLPNP